MKQTYTLYLYDLWADPGGGLSVNDVFKQGQITLNVDNLTDYQLNRAVGGRGLTWDGDPECTLYATDKKGNPACELRRES